MDTQTPVHEEPVVTPLHLPAAPQGVDFYSGDGPIDFVELRRGGRSFAIRKATEGAHVDHGVAEDKPKMHAAGLISGFYCFYRPGVSAEAQAEAYRAAVGDLGPRYLAPVIDLEPGPDDPKRGRKKWDGKSPDEVVNGARELATLMHEAYGVWPSIYSSANVVRDDLDGINTGLAALGCPLWVVQHRGPQPECPPEWGAGNWMICQYAFDNRETHGAHQVDLDRWNVLALGSSGPMVARAQRNLGIRPTGTFDQVMVDATEDFQHAHGLSIDARIGPVTWSYLGWMEGLRDR